MAQQQQPWQPPRHITHVNDYPLITESSLPTITAAITFPTPELITNNINAGIIEKMSARDLVQGETYIIEKTYNSADVSIQRPVPKVYAPILLIGTLATIDVVNKTHNRKPYVGGVFTFNNLERLTGLNPTTTEPWRTGPISFWLGSSKIIEGVQIGFPSVEKYYKILTETEINERDTNPVLKGGRRRHSRKGRKSKKARKARKTKKTKKTKRNRK